MRRVQIILVAAVVVVFFAVGAFLIFRGTGGGGRTVTIDASVAGNTMTPSSLTARQGDHVTLTFTIDKKEEIHLHGYDIKFQAQQPGDKVTHTFTADKSGSFDIEIEDTSTGIGALVVSP
jgi:plastocyanin